MDPVTLIVGALIAGAAKAAEGTAGQAIQDAYDGLKSLIQRRFAGHQVAEIALAQFEQEPEAWEGALKDQLAKTGAAEDPEIVESANRLKEALLAAKPGVSASGDHSAAAGGDMTGVATGDRAAAVGENAGAIVTGDNSTVGDRRPFDATA